MLSSFDIPIYYSKLDLPCEVGIQKYCIQCSEPKQVLALLYQKHNESGILNDLKDSESTIQVLIEYFEEINFNNDQVSMRYIKSLPLFKSIQGQLISIEGANSVYVCKQMELCLSGYHKWATQFGIVFLSDSGMWTILGNFKTLEKEKILVIQPQEVYMELIFPNFRTLAPSERKEHLDYIQHNHFITIKDTEKPSLFFKSLCDLPCLENSVGELQPVSYFCDHTIPVFIAFRDKFSFVPDEYQTEEWLDFLKLLHLQTTLSIEEFKMCCEFVSSKGDYNKSSVLVSYLFSHAAVRWHLDSQILSEIGDIQFVPVDPLEDLQWIKMPHKKDGLAKLNEAVIHDSAALVWTIKPVVKLPTEYMMTYDYINFLSSNSVIPEKNETHCHQTLKKLGVTIEPEVEDVYRNLEIVSNTHLSDFNLFISYHGHAPIAVESIIKQSVEFLFENDAKSHLERLQTIPCIAVSADKTNVDVNFISKPVLVKPLQVVRNISSDCTHLFPYLHSLPNYLLTLDYDLTLIGISDSITFRNLQYLLETMYHHLNGSVMSPNDAVTVREAVIKINILLQSASDKDVADQLSPLYLPNANQCLAKSHELVLIDSSRYQEVTLNLAISPYTLFQLPNGSQFETEVSSSVENKIFRNLPEVLKPLGLSRICKEELLLYSEGAENSFHLIRHFDNLKSVATLLQEFLPKIISAYLNSIKKPTIEKETINYFVQTFTNQFITDIEIIIIESLRCELKLIATNTSVGVTNVQFLFQMSEQGRYILYLDDKANPGTPSFSKEMAYILCLEIARLHKVDLTKYFEFSAPVQECLMAQSSSDLLHTLEKFEIDAADIKPTQFRHNSVALGKDIHDEMLPLLQMDMDHLFRPEEWVGYEIKEGHLIYAILLHRIHTYSNDDENLFGRKYRIRIDDSAYGTKDVSTLDLYKFVSMKQLEESEEKGIIPIEKKEDAVSQVSSIVSSKKLEDLKKDISLVLVMIWQITDEDIYRKGKKRLYLQYHPDKANPVERYVYEEAFKFLQEELKTRIPPTFESNTAHSNLSNSSEQDFYQWNTFAKKTYRKEKIHAMSYIPFKTFHPQSDLFMAEMWLKQARTDLEAMKILKEQLPNKEVHCQVLFLAHETCHKVLKAGMYKLVGLNPSSLKNHNIHIHANAIASVKGDKWLKLPHLIESINDYHLNTRFPSEHSPPTAPVDIYCSEKADCVAENAEDVFELVSLLFEQKLITKSK